MLYLRVVIWRWNQIVNFNGSCTNVDSLYKLRVFPMRPLQHSTSINGSQGLELAIPINEEALPEKKSLNKFGGGWC